ncbi:MAG: hypothetical protein Q7S27_03435 [Nanoarchaeota archaeon]|nr:hypothetical protein [Nanoarchaeota archaeon]
MKKLILLIVLIQIVSAQQALSPSEKTGIFILVDKDAPQVSITSPQNISYNNKTLLLVNYTIIEHTLDTIWYSLNNDENLSISSPFYLSLPEGLYNLKIYANDSFKRTNFSEINFIINNSIEVQPSFETPTSSGSSNEFSSVKIKDNVAIPPNNTSNADTESFSSKNKSDIPKNISIENGSEEKIFLNYQLIILLAIVLLIIISYKFIKNLNKKQKWKKKK